MFTSEVTLRPLFFLFVPRALGSVPKIHKIPAIQAPRGRSQVSRRLSLPASGPQNAPLAKRRDQMTKIAILDDYQSVALKMTEWGSLPAGVSLEAFSDHLSDQGAIVERLKDFDVVVAMRERTPFPRTLLECLPRLRLLVTTGMRNASIDVSAASELGVSVCGTRGMRTGTAELTWGLILSLARHIPEEDRAVREGKWQVQIELSIEGKTLGVIGLGNLGSQVAAVGRALQINVVSWSQNLTAERAEQAGARLVSKDQLFSESDFISVHLILGERSRGLIGASEFARMKPTAIFVNTSRGPIVEEQALMDVLRQRRIAGAGLDVFDEEPLPLEHPFRSLNNVLVTPHIGYVTTENYQLFYQDALENIVAFLGGNPIRVIEASP